MKKLKTSFDSRGRALAHDGLKGKIFSQLRLFPADASTSIVRLFEDKTMFHISLRC